MAKENDKKFNFFFSWMNMFTELDDAEIGMMVKAIVHYAMTGETIRLEDRCLRAILESMKTSVDLSKEFNGSKSEAGKKGGQASASKRNSASSKDESASSTSSKEVSASNDSSKEASASSTSSKVNSASSKNESASNGSSKVEAAEPNRKGKGIGKGIGIEKEEEDEDDVIAEHQQPLPELTEFTAGIIKDCWNAQSVTRDVDRIPIFGTRANNTRLCIDQDFGSFISMIKDLDNQYFFAEMAKQGRPIDYDWFVDPDHYLATREGKYKEKHKGYQQGTEGAWTEDGLEFGW